MEFTNYFKENLLYISKVITLNITISKNKTSDKISRPPEIHPSDCYLVLFHPLSWVHIG